MKQKPLGRPEFSDGVNWFTLATQDDIEIEVLFTFSDHYGSLVDRNLTKMLNDDFYFGRWNDLE